jgi:hypothetical protein
MLRKIELIPNKHKQPLSVGPKEVVNIHFGLYVDLDVAYKLVKIGSDDKGQDILRNIPARSSFKVRCRGKQNTVVCIHSLGKETFELNKRYTDKLLSEIGDKFTEIKNK